MENRNKKIYAVSGILAVLIILLLAVVIYQNHVNSPEVQAENASSVSVKSSEIKAQSESEAVKAESTSTMQKMRKAPAGNYIYILGTDTAYKTSWTRDQLQAYLDSLQNVPSDQLIKPEIDTNLGTSHHFSSKEDDLISGVLNKAKVDDIYFDSALKAYDSGRGATKIQQ